MKNSRELVSEEEVHDFMYDQWQTGQFRDSHESGGYVHRVVEDAARQPMLAVDIEDPVERSHFMALLGIVPLRPEEYQGRPHIADLYLLHELEHLSSLDYNPARYGSDEAWAERVWTNERTASLASEVNVYFEIPGLRDGTFDFQIWADRFLDSRVKLDPNYDDNRKLFAEDKPRFIAAITRERQRAMMDPLPDDTNEELISKYHAMNIEWARIWNEKRVEIEVNMSMFRALAVYDRPAAMRYLKEWIARIQGDDICPYYPLAEEFSKVVAALYS